MQSIPTVQGKVSVILNHRGLEGRDNLVRYLVFER